MAQPVTSKLLECPLEIHNEIFEYLLPYSIPEEDRPPTLRQANMWQARSGFVGLFCTNRSISENALEYFYGKNTFVVDIVTTGRNDTKPLFKFHCLPEQNRPGQSETYHKAVHFPALAPRNIARIRKIQVKLKFSLRSPSSGSPVYFPNCVQYDWTGHRNITGHLLVQVIQARKVLRKCEHLSWLEIKLETDTIHWCFLSRTLHGIESTWIATPIQFTLSLLGTHKINKVQIVGTSSEEPSVHTLERIVPNLERMPALGERITFDAEERFQFSIWRFMIAHLVWPRNIIKVPQEYPDSKFKLQYETADKGAYTIIADSFVLHCFVHFNRGMKVCSLHYEDYRGDRLPSEPLTCPRVAALPCGHDMRAFDRIIIRAIGAGVLGLIQVTISMAAFLRGLEHKGYVEICIDSFHSDVLPRRSPLADQILSPLGNLNGVNNCRDARIMGNLLKDNPDKVRLAETAMTFPAHRRE